MKPRSEKKVKILVVGVGGSHVKCVATDHYDPPADLAIARIGDLLDHDFSCFVPARQAVNWKQETT